MTESKNIFDKTISYLYENDDWVRDFMQEVYDMFGLPVSTEDCLNRQDKILFVWGMMSLIKAMKSDFNWLELKHTHTPEEAAYEYAKKHYDSLGEHILERQELFTTSDESEDIN